jgi:hypothetical protein
MKPRIVFMLRIAAVAVFLGRAWQQIRWDIPIRSLLWDEKLMRPLVEGSLGISWRAWVTSPEMGQMTAAAVKLGGWFYLVAALAAWYARPGRRALNAIVALGALGLVLLAFFYTKEKFYHLGQFWEYSLQFGTPLLLLWYSATPSLALSRAQWLALRMAIALTFVCHGLYAIGYYPRPGNFTEMVMVGFGVDEFAAVQILKGAGVADFFFSALLFIPWRPAQWAGVAYAIVWGALTTAARIWVYLWIAEPTVVLTQWVHESVYRLPHVLGPLAAWYALKPPPAEPIPIDTDTEV